jgi:hypothetical protein
VDLLLKAFAIGSACINPILYCGLNEHVCGELNICGKTSCQNDDPTENDNIELEILQSILPDNDSLVESDNRPIVNNGTVHSDNDDTLQIYDAAEEVNNLEYNIASIINQVKKYFLCSNVAA